ncbi:thiamine pyrophosphate-dependent enzyme [Komagataeibacter rhaeticus]|nr:thiamine pyrophosphate-dependent enzyme [Komagataeibacter rhaeticus]
MAIPCPQALARALPPPPPACAFIGDGSFQMTAQELSTLLRHRCNITIFLINNGGYTIERMILGPQASYNDIANWDYASLPAAFGSGAAPVAAGGQYCGTGCGTGTGGRASGRGVCRGGFHPMDAPPRWRQWGRRCAATIMESKPPT